MAQKRNRKVAVVQMCIRDRLCGYYEIRTNLVFVDDVLPAQTVAVLFLNRTGYQNRIFVA